MKEKRSLKKQPRKAASGTRKADNIYMFMSGGSIDKPTVRDGRGKVRFTYANAKGERLILRKARHGKNKGTFRYFTEEQYQKHLARKG